MAKISKYYSKKNPKVTYLLGAGASYNSVPIWSEQGSSMLQVAESIERAINNPRTIFSIEILESPSYCGFNENEKNYLLELVLDLKKYVEKIEDKGTIDTYAYQLYRSQNKPKLAQLKRALSIYLDIWQFYESYMNFRKSSRTLGQKKQKIDTRYSTWLNMITESQSTGDINIHKNINILSWNYDLQIELAYAEYYEDLPFTCLDDINRRFKFVNDPIDPSKKLNIHHLNGHHGYFKYDNEEFPTAKNVLKCSFYSYLKNLNDNIGQFKIRLNQHHDFNKIKFSWERSLPENIIQIARETDILIIIGYSFPQYNRTTDDKILNAFKLNNPMYIYYQDPVSDEDKINRIKDFVNFERIKFDKSKDDFFIPDEFINPKESQVVMGMPI